MKLEGEIPKYNIYQIEQLFHNVESVGLQNSITMGEGAYIGLCWRYGTRGKRGNTYSSFCVKSLNAAKRNKN